MWTKYPEIFNELKLVEEFISESILSRNKLLSEVVSELVEAGGKRLRPAFVIVASKFGRYDRKKILSVAGAMEILHTATLVHDDIVDKASLRRGKPTVSAKYGTNMAVYTGDFLYTKAVLMLSRDISIERLDIVARAVKTICEGEVDQYQYKDKLNGTAISYLKRIGRKTALFFGAACTLGAGLAKCPNDVVKSLAKFGFYYGMAFQIRDDINDIILDEKTAGKPVGNDIIEGVITLPVIYALNKSVDVREALAELMRQEDKWDRGKLESIAQMVMECGGLDYARDILGKYVERGLKVLKLLPDNRYKDIFKELICSLDSRFDNTK